MSEVNLDELWYRSDLDPVRVLWNGGIYEIMQKCAWTSNIQGHFTAPGFGPAAGYNHQTPVGLGLC